MHVQIVDPSAFTRPYDHALSSALVRQGVEVTLLTSRFAYGAVPAPDGYELREHFYRDARGAPGSRLRTALKLADHVPDMLRYRRLARGVDVVHFQWLDLQPVDRYLLPEGPTVLTAHDLLPREPRPGQVGGQRRLYDKIDAVVTHSEYGRSHLVEQVGVDPAKVHVIHHGAFDYLTRQQVEESLPVDLQSVSSPVALFFGLLRPYKGIDVLLDAWRGISNAELWIVGRPRMPLAPLQAIADGSVRFIPRFVSEAELPAFFRRADVIVLPYSRTARFDQSGVLATALAFGKPIVVSEIGGLREFAATGAARAVAPDDAAGLRDALSSLIGDPDGRERLAAAARAAAAGPYSWEEAARKTVAMYRALIDHRQ
jgi:glycosyltransferase involved in cell wall biosynthesis